MIEFLKDLKDDLQARIERKRPPMSRQHIRQVLEEASFLGEEFMDRKGNIIKTAEEIRKQDEKLYPYK